MTTIALDTARAALTASLDTAFARVHGITPRGVAGYEVQRQGRSVAQFNRFQGLPEAVRRACNFDQAVAFCRENPPLPPL